VPDVVASTLRTQLMDVYQRLLEHFGDRQWWPADTREEMVIGAILVQNVSWQNTVVAIDRLREQGLLNFSALVATPEPQLEACIVSTRYYKTKAKKLKAFAQRLLDFHDGRLDHLLSQSMADLRKELLTIWGIGPETADDIVLYAAGQPSFVVDAYTNRIFARLGWTNMDMPYEQMRSWFMSALPPDAPLYNQYHALLDALGHHFCLSRKPRCRECPLLPVCSESSNWV